MAKVRQLSSDGSPVDGEEEDPNQDAEGEELSPVRRRVISPKPTAPRRDRKVPGTNTTKRAPLLNSEEAEQELPLPRARKAPKRSKTFTSVDGVRYTFATSGPKGELIPGIQTKLLVVAFVEFLKGGNPLNVFETFRYHFNDDAGNPYLPLSPHGKRLAQEQLQLLHHIRDVMRPEVLQLLAELSSTEEEAEGAKVSKEAEALANLEKLVKSG